MKVFEYSQHAIRNASRILFSATVWWKQTQTDSTPERQFFSKTFGKVEKGTKHILPIERSYQITKRLKLIVKLLSVCGVLWKKGGEIRGEILLR